MTPSAEKTTKEIFVNSKPELPSASEDVKYEIKTVSRTVKTVEGETTSTMYVLAPIALTLAGMVAIADNKEDEALKYFNAGYFSTLRTKASNELSGGSEEDKAFGRIVKAVSKLPMFSGKSEDEITVTLRENPALMALFSKA